MSAQAVVPPALLSDADVRALLTPELAVKAARRALVDAYHGSLAAPPRARVELGDTDLVFTAGGYRGGAVGFRAYGTWAGDSDQAVLVWTPDGRLRGCVVGVELGARRTGALGGAAVDVLAPTQACAVGIVGSGRQARSQLWAVTAVRSPESVLVFSPNPEHREAFAGWARLELGLDARAVESAREAVDGSELVILATRSETPVVEPEWIAPGAHVTTVGPKTRSAHEAPPALAEAAAVVASDSPAQAAAYDEAFFTDRPLVHLGAIVAGEHPGRQTADELTLYCSTGLAGSEVVLAEALLSA